MSIKPKAKAKRKAARKKKSATKKAAIKKKTSGKRDNIETFPDLSTKEMEGIGPKVKIMIECEVELDPDNIKDGHGAIKEAVEEVEWTLGNMLDVTANITRFQFDTEDGEGHEWVPAK